MTKGAIITRIFRKKFFSLFDVEFAKVEMVTTYTEHTLSRNMEATYRGNHETIGYPNGNGYYI